MERLPTVIPPVPLARAVQPCTVLPAPRLMPPPGLPVATQPVTAQPVPPLIPRLVPKFESETQFFAVLALPRAMPAGPVLPRAVLSAMTQEEEALMPDPAFDSALQPITIPLIPGAIPAPPLETAVQRVKVVPVPEAESPTPVFERAVQSRTVQLPPTARPGPVLPVARRPSNTLLEALLALTPQTAQLRTLPLRMVRL
jgi:hypothetical protein